jgi:hypothetical protein
MRTQLGVVFSILLLLTACSHSGNLGLVTRPSADPTNLLKTPRGFQEVGPVEGQSCRHFVLAVIPWGEGDYADAVEKALAQRGGDALINVNVETSLYGFFPIYNVYSFTCTTVKGVAIKFQEIPSSAVSSAPHDGRLDTSDKKPSGTN